MADKEKELIRELREYLETREQASYAFAEKQFMEYGEGSPSETAIQDTLYCIGRFLTDWEKQK